MTDTTQAKLLLEAITPLGHWDTDEGRQTAEEYATKERADLSYGDKSDLAIANAIFLVNRDDLRLIHFQTAAKERIRWLSVKLAIANHDNAHLAKHVEELREPLARACKNAEPRRDGVLLHPSDWMALRDAFNALLAKASPR